MAENYKHLYQQTKLMLEKYQDEIVPKLRRLLDERVEVVRCKDCKHREKCNLMTDDDFCSDGERREENEP